MRVVVRANSLFDLALGALLLSSSWEGLFAALDLPSGEPELWTHVAGALLVGFAYLLWIAPREPHLANGVVGAAALANGLGAIVIPVWLVFGELRTGGLGTALLLAAAIALAAFAAAEAFLASRSVAILLPPD